jgi:hypothetical protein
MIKPIMAITVEESEMDEGCDMTIMVGVGFACGVAIDTIVELGVRIAKEDSVYANEVL